MTDSTYHEHDTAMAGLAHLGAIVGPLVPLGVWLARRRDDPWAASQAAAATNFGMLVLVVFALGTAVRLFVPLVAFVGTLAQLAVLAVAAVLCVQAFRAVRRGLPATYPYDIKVVRTA
ncbi:DUF4870 domain-containing protein [uncultured Demequina sp.]|uniref:DUF4870 domain-containing protein n=1 Tax=uncultured Demequina sp. TaxID=693499 RepID=UPI0025EB4AAB|nr:DUF4870 domain-containing protein [uncultured Demequina sp.]